MNKQKNQEKFPLTFDKKIKSYGLQLVKGYIL